MSSPSSKNFACPKCKNVLAIPNTVPSGHRIKCPKCQTVFVKPGAELKAPKAPSVPAAPAAPAATARRSPNAPGAPARKKAPKAQPQPQRAPSRAMLWIGLAGGGFALLAIAGCVMAFVLPRLLRTPDDGVVAPVAQDVKAAQNVESTKSVVVAPVDNGLLAFAPADSAIVAGLDLKRLRTRAKPEWDMLKAFGADAPPQLQSLLVAAETALFAGDYQKGVFILRTQTPLDQEGLRKVFEAKPAKKVATRDIYPITIPGNLPGFMGIVDSRTLAIGTIAESEFAALLDSGAKAPGLAAPVMAEIKKIQKHEAWIFVANDGVVKQALLTVQPEQMAAIPGGAELLPILRNAKSIAFWQEISADKRLNWHLGITCDNDADAGQVHARGTDLWEKQGKGFAEMAQGVAAATPLIKDMVNLIQELAGSFKLEKERAKVTASVQTSGPSLEIAQATLQKILAETRNKSAKSAGSEKTARQPSTGGGFDIKSAMWVTPAGKVDVRKALNAMLAAGKNVTVDQAGLGITVPAGDVEKNLILKFQSIRPEAIGRPSSIRVISAQWGVGNRKADVTKSVAELIKSGKVVRAERVTLQATDPAVSVIKWLTLNLEIDGVPVTFILQDFTGIRFEQDVVAAGGPGAPARGKLQLTMANFEKIKDGMPIRDVEKLLGGPGKQETKDGLTSVNWTDIEGGVRVISVVTAGGKVLAKSQVGLEGSTTAVREAPGESIVKEMKFVRLAKGEFYAGGGGGKAGTKTQIKNDFEIASHTITQSQWQNLMGNNPSWFARTGGGSDKVKDVADNELRQFPVEQVSWDDAQALIKKLNEKEEGKGWTYRLPTAAEWEYACRGGAHSPADCSYYYYFDEKTNTLTQRQANCNNFVGRTTRVGLYKANSLGLYDMHGNINQWCEDALPAGSTSRILRGGSWRDPVHFCRAAVILNGPKTGKGNNLGIRLVRVASSGGGGPTVPAPGKLKLTMANFEKIKDGMPIRDVEKLLGGPGKQETKDGLTSVTWTDIEGGVRVISVVAAQGKVLAKSQVGLEARKETGGAKSAPIDTKDVSIKGQVNIGTHKFKLQEGSLYQFTVQGKEFMPTVVLVDGNMRNTADFKEPNTFRGLLLPSKSQEYKILVAPNVGAPEGRGGLLDYTVKLKILRLDQAPVLKKADMLTAASPKYQQSFRKTAHNVYPVQMKAARTYMIEMVRSSAAGNKLLPYLYLENPGKMIVAEDNDIGGDFNSRIVFIPTTDGEYRIIASAASDDRGVGDYTLTVRVVKDGK